MPRYEIPVRVKWAAQLALRMKQAGMAGGTPTGVARARQLANSATVSHGDVRVMRAWFARHGPDAANGGTSYPGYTKWLQANRPIIRSSEYRGAVAWLLWGGTPAYRWVNRVTLA